LKIFDAAIIGAGPAGCACATWFKQLGFSPLLIDNHASCGGLQLQSAYINPWIPTSPATATGRDLAATMHQNILSMGIDTSLKTQALSVEKAEGQFRIHARHKEKNEIVFYSRYLVLAGGVVPKAERFTEGPNIFIGATPKLTSADFAGKTVAILGGGDNAFENYSLIKSKGASSITIFARTVRAQLQLIKKVPASDVTRGSFAYEPGSLRVNGRDFDCIVVMFGYEVNPRALLGLTPQLKQDGYILTDASCQTSLKDVFAIGEITGRAHPCCLTAMADGVVAAKALQKLIEGPSITG
jgi:thioredoxin reductase (NADPH)